MSEWQPIETAPGDGTEIDVWVPDGAGGYRVPDAYWCGADRKWRQTGQCHHLSWHAEPTHWMPSPHPPATLDTK